MGGIKHTFSKKYTAINSPELAVDLLLDDVDEDAFESALDFFDDLIWKND